MPLFTLSEKHDPMTLCNCTSCRELARRHLTPAQLAERERRIQGRVGDMRLQLIRMVAETVFVRREAKRPRGV